MKILMCRPLFYDIEYIINPWMNLSNQPDQKKTFLQWERLYNKYIELGVEVKIIDQVKHLPDMVFTANAGTVRGNLFISGNYRFAQRKGEEEVFQKWFLENGYEVKKLHHFQGGEGDALFYKNCLYMGYGFRSEVKAHKEIEEILKIKVISLRLIDPYFYDFDTAFCPIGNHGFLYYPKAFSKEDCLRLSKIDGAIEMTKEQAENFIGNSVYIKNKLLVSFIDDDLQKKLSSIQVEPILFDMSEFKKAGGGIKCLTLYLDK